MLELAQMELIDGDWWGVCPYVRGRNWEEADYRSRIWTALVVCAAFLRICFEILPCVRTIDEPHHLSRRADAAARSSSSSFPCTRQCPAAIQHPLALLEIWSKWPVAVVTLSIGGASAAGTCSKSRRRRRSRIRAAVASSIADSGSRVADRDDQAELHRVRRWERGFLCKWRMGSWGIFGWSNRAATAAAEGEACGGSRKQEARELLARSAAVDMRNELLLSPRIMLPHRAAAAASVLASDRRWGRRILTRAVRAEMAECREVASRMGGPAWLTDLREERRNYGTMSGAKGWRRGWASDVERTVGFRLRVLHEGGWMRLSLPVLSSSMFLCASREIEQSCVLVPTPTAVLPGKKLGRMARFAAPVNCTRQCFWCATI